MAQGRYDDDWHGPSDQGYRRMGEADYRGDRAGAYRQRSQEDMRRSDREDDRYAQRDAACPAGRGQRGDDDYTYRGRDDGHAYGFVHGSRQGRHDDDDRQQGWGRRDRSTSAGDGPFGDYGPGASRRHGGDQAPSDYAQWGDDQGARDRGRLGTGGAQRFGEMAYPGGGMQGQGGMFGPSGQPRGSLGAGHRGKGPQDYTRSDERIREDCCDRLADSDSIDASNLTVSVSGGEVTLQGKVASRHEKRAAEDCVEQCSGVTHVQNNLRVGERSAASENGAGDKDQGSNTRQSPPGGKSGLKDA